MNDDCVYPPQNKTQTQSPPCTKVILIEVKTVPNNRKSTQGLRTVFFFQWYLLDVSDSVTGQTELTISKVGIATHI